MSLAALGFGSSAGAAVGAFSFFADVDSLGLGFANDEDMMAGSTGAPGTVACPVGARMAGGVYLFAPPAVSGLISPRWTPLYLNKV